MTKRGIGVFARVLIFIALLSVFLPFFTVNGNNIFGSSMFATFSVEKILGLEDALVAGPNVFYIIAVIATAATLVLSFLRTQLKPLICMIGAVVASVAFLLVGVTFDSTYSFYGSFAEDGVSASYSVGWYLTTCCMLAAAALYAVIFIFKNKIIERRMISEVQRRNNKGWWFVSPFIIGFLCFYLQPLMMSLWYTFNNFRLDTESGGGFILTFTGLENLDYMFNKETDFWQTLTDTLKDMLITVPIVIIFSMFIAVILNQKFHGRVLARAIFFMPVVVTGGIVIGIINGDSTTQFMDQSVETTDATTIFTATGLLEILEGMNLPEDVVTVFTDIVSSIFDTLWKCGVQILLFLSALQSVPSQLYEAAKVEGATGWEMFWKVTFPNLTPIILVNIIYTIIDSLADPGNSLMKSIDNTAFVKFSYHTACLEAWIFFIILLVIVGAVFGIFALLNRSKAAGKR